MPSLTPGRFASQTLDLRATSSQRAMPSTTVAGIGGVGFSPLHLRGLALWLDAADTSTITSSSGAVSQWNDKSGYGRNVSQATGSRQPTTGATTQNNRNVLTFDGGDWLDTGSATVLPQPFSIFAVAWHTSGASNINTRIVCNLDDINSQMTSGVFGGTMVSWYSNPDGVTAGTYTGSTFGVLGVIANGAQSIAFANNVAGATNAASGTGAFRAARIGAKALVNGEQALIGRIAEVVIYARALTPGERAALHGYLFEKWAI